MRSVRAPKFLLALTTAAVLVLAACGSDSSATSAPAPGAEGTWELMDPGQVTPDSTSIDIGVTRIACASGMTGEIEQPIVSYEPDQIIIRSDVVPHEDPDAVFTCPGNDAVPVTVKLDEPIGDREMVDGICLAGEATGITPCADSVRWQP
ncbi:hypothetical protein V5R04_00730 [Jonesiaceae bacterium BS-20]|uniref:Uncharacterized protein n=1 Tax=Jonesiaceae bacterium BS-20 TaxID=3120821 RepID=A0AAU7DUX3_9MICO